MTKLNLTEYSLLSFETKYYLTEISDHFIKAKPTYSVSGISAFSLKHCSLLFCLCYV